MIRSSLVLVLLVGLGGFTRADAQSSAVPAPVPGNRVATIFQNQLTLVENDVVSLAQAMPAERYDFKPTNGEFTGVRTFGEQVKHLATMIYMTAAIVLEEK